MEEKNLAQNAHETGAYLRSGLEDLQKKYQSMGDVRDKGLMLAVEFVGENKTPDTELVGKLFEEIKFVKLHIYILWITFGSYE